MFIVKVGPLVVICISFFPSFFLFSSETKPFKKCEFARIAKQNGLANVSTWTCIAFHESRLKYDVRNGGFYGIFQISREHWCGIGKKCGITCESLLNADLIDDIRCVKQIYDATARRPGKNGFSQWGGFSYCQGDQEYWINGYYPCIIIASPAKHKKMYGVVDDARVFLKCVDCINIHINNSVLLVLKFNKKTTSQDDKLSNNKRSL